MGKNNEKTNSIEVKLIAKTDTDPLELSSHAALKCYQAEDPQFGKKIDVENRLFKVGHHTTLQHSYFTFSIEGIAIGDITFGLHLCHPFYNSDQRSGRYCAQMFLEPDFGKMRNYIKEFWPEVNKEKVEEVISYIKKGVEIYQSNISDATEVAKTFLANERPNANEKYINQSAPKIAQEQVRVFIPVVFPTGFDHTINLSTLVALYRSAWSPVLKCVTQKMVDEVLREFPELNFMFREEDRANNEWSMNLPETTKIGIKNSPALKLISFSEKSFKDFLPSDASPVDLLHFLPSLMDNSFEEVSTEIEISVATMGQDQRHRTLRRSEPKFTGNFYLPPIAKKLGLEKEAVSLMKQWIKVSKGLPKSLSNLLVPYGAMVKYKKSGSINAVIHEQAKRLCFCAQEEIYNLARKLRAGIIKKNGKKSKIAKIFEPPCYEKGKCLEGARYCGRDMNKRKTGDYFPQRKV